MDDRDDRRVSAALRRRADALDIGDIDAAATSVRRRAGRQRALRVGAMVLSVGVLAVAGVVAVRSLDGQQEVVRTPATTPPVVTTLPPAPPTTLSPTTTAPPTTVPGTAAQTSAASGTTSTRRAEYDSLGGSITVEQVGSTIRLVGEPEPFGGYSVEVEDDGPDRVRVRFESGERRSRITVELVDGTLVPRIDEE